MIDDPRGCVEYEESGSGPAIVFVPGSCSTGAAWRPIISALDGFRCVTTSVLGYGKTAERRGSDCAIADEVDAVEAVMRRAGGRVHLVGHSFGGLVAVATTLRTRPASLTVIEAPAVMLLRDQGEEAHHRAFRAMTDDYFAAFGRGEPAAIAAMIDFYGGSGTFASWPQRLRDYAIETTAVNIRDWQSAYGFPLSKAVLSAVTIPVLVLRGGTSPEAVRRANELLAESMNGSVATVEGAAHFMIATHAGEVAQLIAAHVRRAEAARG